MSPRPLAATLVAAAVAVGVGSGAATYAALSARGTKTIVQQVTVPSPSAQPTANTSVLSINSVYRRAYKGVVKLTVSSASTGPFGDSQSQQAEGSGFVYDTQGHIVTNAHVVAGASVISVKFWNGATYKAHLVGSDASTDLAVIKVDASASLLTPLTLGDSGKLVVGDGVVAIGSPFGLDETVTAGIVSALHRQMTSPNNFTIDDSIQTDAAINHGNSGGPLLNLQGEVIGVNAQIASDTGGNNGVGFAIPSNTVHAVVTQLLGSGTVKHAYLGVTLGTSTQVGSVRSGTPAAKAGLRAGDVITALDGTRVASGAELRSAINGKQPGDSITVTYTRGGQSHTVRLTLASRPK